jgi:hypothetical protein
MDQIDITHLVTNNKEQKESDCFFLDLSNMPDYVKCIIEDAVKSYTTITENKSMGDGEN